MSPIQAALLATACEVSSDTVLRAFSIQVTREESQSEVLGLLGRQAGYVTKS